MMRNKKSRDESPPEEIIPVIEAKIPLSNEACDLLTVYSQQLSQEVILHAFNTAVDGNHLTWNYLNGILKRYFNAGLTDMASVTADESKFIGQRGGPSVREADTIGKGITFDD